MTGITLPWLGVDIQAGGVDIQREPCTQQWCTQQLTGRTRAKPGGLCHHLVQHLTGHTHPDRIPKAIMFDIEAFCNSLEFKLLASETLGIDPRRKHACEHAVLHVHFTAAVRLQIG